MQPLGCVYAFRAVDQRYVIEDNVQRGYVGARDARTFLPFLLPHLRPGMDVLDVGCGVGAIALDLAPAVAPGRVAGVDIDAGQLADARAEAARRGIADASFRAGSVYELPFEDASFDAAYANAVFMYVREPVRALAEMRRVLRPGGVAAVCDDDLGTIVLSPDAPELRLAPTLFEKAVAHEGGDTRYSRHLRTLMLEAGFARTQGVAHAPEVYGDAVATRWFADFAIGVLSAASMRELIVAERWATPTELDAVLAGLDRWAGRPDAFAAWLYCGALGWVA
jgi:SAM-dependent methyltransferase